MISVPVVSAVRSAAKLMAKCLVSVRDWRRESRFGCEHIVMDDGSEDETADIVRTFAASNGGWRLL